jgi:LysM repeat protein
MPVSSGLVKARLENLDRAGEYFACHFNPSELAISKTNTWNAPAAAGAHVPAVHFGGVGARTLELTLTFDTFDRPVGSDDVSAVLHNLSSLMDATESETVHKKKTPRPPHVLFRFGSWYSFPAVVKDLTQTFTLFKSNGTPVRAHVKLTLQEVPDESKAKKKGQNPTSLASGTRRIHQVQPGDTLDLIAATELGDPEAWRRIADLNDLDDPRRLRPGTLLAMPADDATPTR